MPNRPVVSICRTCGVHCAGDDLKGYREWWHLSVDLSVEQMDHEPDPDPDLTTPYISLQEP